MQNGERMRSKRGSEKRERERVCVCVCVRACVCVCERERERERFYVTSLLSCIIEITRKKSFTIEASRSQSYKTFFSSSTNKLERFYPEIPGLSQRRSLHKRLLSFIRLPY
jgi:hypothetical protein